MDNDAQNLMEKAAGIMSDKFVESLKDDVNISWPDIAHQISKDPDKAKSFFGSRTIKLAQIYVSSMNLFVDMDENSDLISGIQSEAKEEEEEEVSSKTRFDFDEEE